MLKGKSSAWPSNCPVPHKLLAAGQPAALQAIKSCTASSGGFATARWLPDVVPMLRLTSQQNKKALYRTSQSVWHKTAEVNNAVIKVLPAQVCFTSRRVALKDTDLELQKGDNKRTTAQIVTEHTALTSAHLIKPHCTLHHRSSSH